MSAFGAVLGLGPLPPLTLPLAVAVEDLANAFDDDVCPVGAQPVRIRRDSAWRSGGKRTDTGSVRRCFGWIFTFFLPTRFHSSPTGRMDRKNCSCSSRSFQAILSRPHPSKRRWASSSARNRAARIGVRCIAITRR